ncbi:MAG: hypothetical protein ACLQFM_14810 [Terriglobales bacterium]
MIRALAPAVCSYRIREFFSKPAAQGVHLFKLVSTINFSHVHPQHGKG